MHNRFLPYVVLAAGVFIVAGSSILIRLAQSGGALFLVIACWRMIIAVLIVTPVAWARQSDELGALSRRHLLWAVAGGFFLAAHLACWIASLEYTSVASSTGLVCTYPLWVALMGFFLLKERLSRYSLAGLSAALAGALLITMSDGGVMALDLHASIPFSFNWHNINPPLQVRDTAMLGNSLALAGGLFGAGYFVVGRAVRPYLSNLAYIWLVYSAAMVALLVVTVVGRQPLSGYSPQVYLLMTLIGLGPQLLGHTAFNWALAHLSATFVALSVLGEPIGSAILACFILGEAFAPLQLAGFVVLLGGIGLGVLGEQKRRCNRQ